MPYPSEQAVAGFYVSRQDFLDGLSQHHVGMTDDGADRRAVTTGLLVDLLDCRRFVPDKLRFTDR